MNPELFEVKLELYEILLEKLKEGLTLNEVAMLCILHKDDDLTKSREILSKKEREIKILESLMPNE